MHLEDVALIRANGLTVRCAGLFDGELIVMVDENHKALLIVMMASNPDLSLMMDSFSKLCYHNFVQCIFKNPIAMNYMHNKQILDTQFSSYVQSAFELAIAKQHLKLQLLRKLGPLIVLF